MRQNNADLRRYYRMANRLYFRNTLPKDMPMRFYKLRKAVGRTLVTRNGKKAVEIRISEKLRTLQAITIMVVMHEMQHVEKPSHEGHGWRFDKRMLRLAKAGAFDGLW